MEVIIKRAYKIFVVFIIAITTIAALSLLVNAKTVNEERYIVRHCDCGGPERYIRDLEVSGLRFEKFSCETCNNDFYYFRSNNVCGHPVVYLYNEIVGGVNFHVYYCESCENLFYCDFG